MACHSFTGYYIWFIFCLKGGGKFWFPPFKISNFKWLQGLFFFLLSCILFSFAAVIRFNSMKATNHKTRTGTNPPAVFFSLTNMFSVHLFSLSAVCLQVSWIDTRWWWSVLRSGAFGWLCSSCDPLSAHRAFLKDKGLAARTLIHTVKLN